MSVSTQASKMNIKLVKSFLDVRPIYTVTKIKYSHNVKDIFKFYKEDECSVNNKYRILDEKDYNRFLSKRALKRQPALTRQISKYFMFFL